jgi:hypothetical protein
MKKEKFALNFDPSGNPRASSTALTLQQLNKEKEKKDTAEETVKVRCKICFKEVAPTRRCFGHGGGGGGGGSDSESTTEENDKQDIDTPFTMDDQFAENHEELVGELDLLEIREELNPEDQSDDNTFDPDVIAELVAKGLLLINNDRKSMTLTIELQCDLKTLSKEQREELKKFMDAIIKEFNVFKEQHHLSDDCLKVVEDEKGNILSLRVNLPTLALYDAFIQQLAANLQPRPSQNSLIKEERQTKSFAPNPLSMEPKPATKNKDLRQDAPNQKQEKGSESAQPNAEDVVVFNPSPFSLDNKLW